MYSPGVFDYIIVLVYSFLLFNFTMLEFLTSIFNPPIHNYFHFFLPGNQDLYLVSNLI